jgi:hypothetical protein
MKDWRTFVAAHGAFVRADHLAAIIGQPESTIRALRSGVRCGHGPRQASKGFAELFSLWHGRAPGDDEWPAPRRLGARTQYEWLPPEMALLASLVGRIDVKQIASILTARLVRITGDVSACRTAVSVQVRMNKLGLQSTDVLGGLTASQAAREIGSRSILDHAIRAKQISVQRVGRYLVIPHNVWEDWKAKRTTPPAGYIRLASIRQALAIRSDKLSEYARMGYVPDVLRVMPIGERGPSTQYGVWYIRERRAKKLIVDRRRGCPMPWHGMPTLDNLRATWKLFMARRHPKSCSTCGTIWGPRGAPRDFDDYCKRYPPLVHGAKRHLTMKWSPGLTIAQLAATAGTSVSHVTRAIANGQLKVCCHERRKYISHTEATRWRARRCPTGGSERSWLALPTATKLYGFSRARLLEFIESGVLQTKVGADGAMKGIRYVARQQCAKLRAQLGYSEREAARRVGVSVARLRVLLRGLRWRQAEAVPIEVIRAAQQRLESNEGYTIEQAAARLRRDVSWVRERIRDGSVRVSRTRWDRRRVYITAPMLERLAALAKSGTREVRRVSSIWLPLSEAAIHAGVCTTTFNRWADEGSVARRQTGRGWRFPSRVDREAGSGVLEPHPLPSSPASGLARDGRAGVACD